MLVTGNRVTTTWTMVVGASGLCGIVFLVFCLCIYVIGVYNFSVCCCMITIYFSCYFLFFCLSLFLCVSVSGGGGCVL